MFRFTQPPAVLLLGILQNKVCPFLDPTRPDGSELSTFSYGGEVSLPVPFSPLFIDLFAQYGEVINLVNLRDAYMQH